jgi:hypothetical protein
VDSQTVSHHRQQTKKKRRAVKFKVERNLSKFYFSFCRYLDISVTGTLPRAGRLKDPSSSPCRVKIFLLSTSSRPILGPTKPTIQWIAGVLFPGVKRSGRETDHSSPTNADVKITWLFISTSPYVFMVVKHRDKFTLHSLLQGLGPPLSSSGQSFCIQIQRSRV